MSAALAMTITDKDALLVVDVQNDFCDGGRLAVPDGSEVVELINAVSRRFRNVILTQDWHPEGHHSFASAHPGRKPFETITLPYGPQVLWPDHCVEDTDGAAFHPGLKVPHAQLIVRKGYRREIDSYSAFYENDHRTPTGLAGYLRDRSLERVFLVGLALDFCVRYSALDAQRCGLRAVVLEDACRSITAEGAGDARGCFAERDIACLRVAALA
jgi:nicotinamidase/pyrazinamidase